jgi:ribosomal protein S18 acetylase RimI-like enzyme
MIQLKLDKNRSAAGKIVIRPAEASDAYCIDVLSRHLDEIQALARPDLYPLPTAANSREPNFLARILLGKDQQIFVALAEGDIAGYVHIGIKHTQGSGTLKRSYSEIYSVAVAPGRQRIGVGQMLVEAAIAWAEAKDVRDHQVNVHAFNLKARLLYERIGFMPSATLLRIVD